jgi:hypothetical protein
MVPLDLLRLLSRIADFVALEVLGEEHIPIFGLLLLPSRAAELRGQEGNQLYLPEEL